MLAIVYQFLSLTRYYLFSDTNIYYYQVLYLLMFILIIVNDTSFVNLNLDIKDGLYRPLDLQKTPFQLEPPLKIVSYYEKLSKCKNLTYVAGDKMVSGYSNQKGIINVDLTDLNFETNFFDLIICNHVLEHIQDDKKAIFEMFRVLKKGGKAVITVPINEKLNSTYEDSSITKASDRIKHFGQWDHVRWYGLDIKERISKVGFDVEMNRYSNNFSKKDYIRYGFSDSLIIIANKL